MISPVRERGSVGAFQGYVTMNVCRDCMHKSTATQTYYHRMTAHLSADGRNHEPQCTMVDAAYVPAESIRRDSFQFIQVGFASIVKSR